LRRAGRAILPDGRVLLWTVAEGRRGRRWRGSTRAANGLIDDLLLEVDAEGRFDRVELTTAVGQLTFHPEPDRQGAHGNVVLARGVLHLALTWSARHGLEVPGSPIADLALAVGSGLAVGEERVIPVARVSQNLVPTADETVIRRASERSWMIAGTRPVEIDSEDLPVMVAAQSWPLEQPAG